MSEKRCKGILISDFTIDNLAGYLDNDGELPEVKSIVAPFNQVTQVLMDRDLKCREKDMDFAVVWTRPESMIRSFARMIDYKKMSVKDVFEEVDEFSSLLLNIRDKVKNLFVPTWSEPPGHRGLGMLDMRPGIGITNTLMRMNIRLSENLSKAPNIYIMDAQKWIRAAGRNASNPKLWYMGKIPFGNDVFIEAAKDIKSALRGVTGVSGRLIILDLDDTLWGGIAGDVGWENIVLGGHDPVGEAYVDFQRTLKSLTNRGVLLGIVSKNEEKAALEVINKHPEMVLELNDFAGWRINWDDKARNIIDLISDLNLGFQSAVFIDDNPAERSRIREAIPEVFVPEWPKDAMFYASALMNLRCFDVPCLSKEDLKRTRMYVSERSRKDLRRAVASLDGWLEGLCIKVKAEALNEVNLPRAAQLLNKTNQMNLATRRLTESDLADWAKGKNRTLWTFRVSDKFGDSGLAGIASIEVKKGYGEIVDFVLSCRVMGRKIEEVMLYIVTEYARSIGLKEVCSTYIPSPKNKPCLDFFKNSGFEHESGRRFAWRLDKKYKNPEYIEIIKKA